MKMTSRNVAIALVLFGSSLFTATKAAEHREQTYPLAGTTFTLALDTRFTPSQKEKLTQWINQTAHGVSLISGTFPIPQTRIEVSKASYGQGPVPWGQINRDGIEGITFYVNANYPLDAFQRDWTGMHEFSHLLIPFPGHDDIWLSEGLASYFQNMLRGRQKILTESQVWQEMHAGFQRGLQDALRQQRPLRELSESMWSTGSYKRVYWSGAAYFLMVDVALQKANSRHSVSNVLATFQLCCRMQDRRWTGPKMITEFDRLSQSTIFSDTYKKIIDQDTFPDLTSEYQWLGLDLYGGKLVLNDSEELRQRRHKLLFDLSESD
ncbi:hypothetical protein ACFSJ3_10620 [Corallincola platygyrae]|uniref:Peptidase M61 catalytic domain-containing protein n=1 Tax=Corallincola platygyrae TaxID=1193278 RepID=A0ABW4XMU3_9GAMM